ncbi:hypothetical protein [Xenorhabdus koppenhoeferi]|uniref:Pilin (Type 1 fimbria component protein) n=1 Tax=Xenorhabdus koppenhoeferi TaxID=351659 RepID=A0A1I7JR95_9GAMM|nr:hypothetical protein [Xenorhabdus koppenhoeferi]CEE91461.1 conserved exported hypothetical protein [Xenorhabdus nematophila str. Anatoliense]SFU87638.1 hypothetical protein SAMN05421784_13729 [Xenorhabdus koppenhoeferi]
MKTTLFKSIFFTSLLSLLATNLISVNSVAQDISSGVIRFSGAIVSPPCSVDLNNESSAKIQCFTDNKKSSKTINLKHTKEISGKLEGLATFTIKQVSKDIAILVVEHI